MEITKLSTKGQVVIPDSMRGNLKVGTPFLIFKKNNLIILKSVEGFSEKEKKEFLELEKIWKDIDNGKGVTQSKADFIKELENW
jgi:bifunctional DNA-binding transcriptional regulator/antitoxin component of YhaV-PrlF toxin-antitoxin module